MGEMAAQLAHQLRTHWLPHSYYTQLENLELPSATRISIAQKACRSLKHLERLIQDMLLFARGEVLGRETIVISELLQELRANHRAVGAFARRGLPCRDNLDATRLTGNRKAIFGALTNLLENALQAGLHRCQRRGGACGASYGRNLAFSVKDNGPGMTPAVLTRLFEPFFTTRGEGTGLGLAIARGVVRAHGGNIEVRSAQDLGSEFIVTLRCQGWKQHQRYQGKMPEHLKILVVEDDDALRDALLITLEAAGHTVQGACGGPQALEMIARTQFNMVVSDLRMAPMDGLSLLSEIRARARVCQYC